MALSMSIWKLAGSHATNRGRRWFHDAARQVAENVKLGITTGPGRSSTRACSVRISPEVHELTATTCGTPRCSAARSSSSATSAPLVRIPESYDGSSRLITRSSGGRAGRANGTGVSNAGRPPRIASSAAAPRCTAHVRRGLELEQRLPGPALVRSISWPASSHGTPCACEDLDQQPHRGMVVAVRDRSRELVDVGVELLPLQRDLRLEHGDRRVIARSQDLGVVVQPLLHALAGTKPDVRDRDVVLGAQAGEPDHLAGQVEDRHGLAHVEQEDLALVGHRARLEHEAHRFGDGHEVAGHVGAGDRHRAAVEDLVEERRHDAAAAAEDVAEPHGDERPVVAPADVEDDLLGDALGGAHDRARVCGLVGGHVHQARGSRASPPPARRTTCRGCSP